MGKDTDRERLLTQPAKMVDADQTVTLMGVSTRHARCTLTAYRKEGAAAIAHGNRGSRPANATPETISTSIVHLARTRYVGVNHTHMSELLSEHEGIGVTCGTPRRLQVSAGENGPRGKRTPSHRVRRHRAPREVMLIQLDGGNRGWISKGGSLFTLLPADRRADTASRHTARILCGSRAVFKHTPSQGLPPLPPSSV